MIRKLAWMALFASTGLLHGCGGGDPDASPAASTVQPAAAPVQAAALEGNFYGDWPAGPMVARTQAQWDALWAAHDAMQTPAPRQPAFDFSASTLVGVSKGWGPNGCHSLEIAGVTETATQIRVTYRERDASAPGVACSQSLVPLVAFATIPATSKAVTFEEVG